MTIDEVKGAANTFKGTVKEAIGRQIGNRQLVLSGLADKEAGRFQSVSGKAMTAVRDALRQA